ncbi:6432_t:CDS:2, partial [Acaulospora colombiana]
VPVEKMLLHQKESLRQSLMILNPEIQKDATRCFKAVQRIMGDRPRGRGPVDVLEDIRWLLDRGIFYGELRDEIYVQICKQLNKNPNGGKVLTLAEIERAKEAPFNPSVFGESLEFIMDLQKQTHPELKVPRILPFLADAIIELKGQSTEGIFRVPGDAEFITELKLRIEKNRYDISGITDPNVPSSLLKLWLRDLADPLIPADFYDRCIKFAEDKDMTIEIVKSLPEINKRVVTYTIDFLQKFYNPETTILTKMNVHNLAMCFAPNFLRCPSDNLSVIFENTKYEQAFVRTLLLYLRSKEIITDGGENHDDIKI